MLRSYCRGGVSQRARFTRGSGAHTAERLPLRPALTGSRVVSGAPRSCQNAHDITPIINNYRLSTDGRADGHTATEICLISARPFPDIFPRAHSCLLPGGKILMKKKQKVYERKLEILLEVLSHSPPFRRKNNDPSPALTQRRLCNMLLCESLNSIRRKAPCCSSLEAQFAQARPPIPNPEREGRRV